MADKEKVLALIQLSQFGMEFVNRYGYYYDRDWGRLRCHSCGHADGGSGDGRDHIIHADDCRMIAHQELWASINQLEEEEDE